MEMSSECLRPDSMPQPGRPIRGPHGGWQKQEIEALQKSIEEAEKNGESLRSVFERMGHALGRRPNSIRNFYYAQVRTQEDGESGRTLPFETFSPEEVEHLIEDVLTARAQGMSVRACVRRLANGDRTRMLRYQNKYRSTIRTRPELVCRIMDRLAQAGIPFVSPYASAQPQAEHAMPRLRERAQHARDPRLDQFFSSLDYLLDLALNQQTQPSAPLAADSDAQRRADRLSAHCDMLRIALSSEQERTQALEQETQGMIVLIKEFIALPPQDRAEHSEDFCRQAAQRLSAVECALMHPDT